MRRFRYDQPGFADAFPAFVSERRETPEEVDTIVRDVLAAVRSEGVGALLRYALEFDRIELTEATLRVSADEIAEGAAKCPAEVRDAIAFAADPVSAAKVATQYAKDNDKFTVVGGFMGQQVLDKASVTALATLPSLDQLRAKIIGLLQAPATKVAGVLQAPAGQLARVMGAYAAKDAA